MAEGPTIDEKIRITETGKEVLDNLVKKNVKLNAINQLAQKGIQKKASTEERAEKRRGLAINKAHGMAIADNRTRDTQIVKAHESARADNVSRDKKHALGREMGNEMVFAKKLGLSYAHLQKGLNNLGWVLDSNNQLHKDTGEKIKDQSGAQGKLVASTKRFRMELLSVMFFGMAVARMFGSLTKGSLEASGAMGVWSTLTMLLGLPAAEKMTDWLLQLYDAYDALPGPVQSFISWTLFAGQAAGSALMAFGMFGLGIQGLKTAFPTLFGWLVKTKWGFSSLAKGASSLWSALGGGMAALGTIVAAIALLALSVALIVKNFDDFKEGLRVWGQSLIHPIKFVKELFNAIKRLGGVMETVKMFFSPIAELFGAKRYAPKGFAKMQTGGIVTRPTAALIGEAGPEAVVPLGSGGGFGNVTYAPTINVSANIAHDMDINNLARRLSEIMYSDLRRLGIR